MLAKLLFWNALFFYIDFEHFDSFLHFNIGCSKFYLRPLFFAAQHLWVGPPACALIDLNHFKGTCFSRQDALKRRRFVSLAGNSQGKSFYLRNESYLIGLILESGKKDIYWGYKFESKITLSALDAKSRSHFRKCDQKTSDMFHWVGLSSYH